MNKRIQFAVAAWGLCLLFAVTTLAQSPMGLNFFHKPSIADIFKPVVGTGAVYETDRNQKKETLEMSVVAKDTADGKEAFWLEFGHTDARTGQLSYAKMLVTKDDFQFHRMVVQPPGQEPIEMPINPGAGSNRHTEMQDAIEKWHKVGTETITVPAGTFTCDHWSKDDGKGDVWASSQVSPMSLVKQVSPDSTMVLVKVFTDAKDHITGTPRKMDFQQMMQQHQQKP
jgi:hypothetical protein